jgi:hypothetical protein
VWRTFLSSLLPVLFGCSVLNPAGALLADARELRPTDPHKALELYEKLISDYPDSDEAKIARVEGPTAQLEGALRLLPDDPDGSVSAALHAFSDWTAPPAEAAQVAYVARVEEFVAGQAARGHPLAAGAMLCRLRNEDFPAAFEERVQEMAGRLGDCRSSAAAHWLASEGMDDASRLTVAGMVITWCPGFQTVIQDWLAQHSAAEAPCPGAWVVVSIGREMTDVYNTQAACEAGFRRDATVIENAAVRAEVLAATHCECRR